MTEQKIVLIAYPREFLCYEKFKRKVDYYLSKSDRVQLLAYSDPNSFIKIYADDRNISFALSDNAANDTSRPVSHAILFEDRNCHEELKLKLSARHAKYRSVALSLTKVVNRDKDEPYDVYVGRGTIWGNPYQLGPDGDREEVIRKFEYDFKRGFLKASDDFESNISKLKGKVIACHCKPAACHADVIANYINSLDDVDEG